MVIICSILYHNYAKLFSGIYDHDTKYDTYVNILNIPELVSRKRAPNLELGGGTNLHDFIEIMERVAT